MAKTWYVSHPSGGHQNSPGFFHAVNTFALGQEGIQIILPSSENELHTTKEAIAQADLVLAELSLSSTGSGIELGWASAYNKPIIGFYQAGSAPSPAVKFVTNQLHSYISEEEVVAVLQNLV
jgi:nucleoside 2-deoxyribosyltransferase